MSVRKPKLLVYHARITRDGAYWLATFADAPGCQTFTMSRANLAHVAKTALEGWLEAHLDTNQVPNKPSAHRRSGLPITVSPRLAARVRAIWAQKRNSVRAPKPKSRFYALAGKREPIFLVNERGDLAHYSTLEKARAAAANSFMGKAFGFVIVEFNDKGYVATHD